MTKSDGIGSERFRYDAAGTLRPPGLLGRTVRLGLGLWCGYAVWMLVTVGSGMVTSGDLRFFPGWWTLAAVGILVFPDVFNIGWGLRIPARRLQATVLAVGLLAAGVSWALTGSPLRAPLGGVIFLWLLYTWAHLGIAFLLSAVIATPGCEMRSIPQLWGMIWGRAPREHYCPGILSPVDRWEAKLFGGKDRVD
jgi:hypothetical protein